MEVYVHFKEVNSDYSQDIADKFHEGKESEDNIKYTWEDELKVTENVIDFKILNRSIYKLKGTFPDNTPFSFDIPEMTILECKAASGNIIQFAVSRKLIKHTEKKHNAKRNLLRFYFFLKDTFPTENPFPGVYILTTDFPSELK